MRSTKDLLALTEEAAECRRQAVQCLELAKRVSLQAHRDRLREMAKELVALAKQEDGTTER